MRTISLIAALLTLLAAPLAQAAGGPLVIIRHNQKHVEYEKSLYGALREAVRVKPDVRFSVVFIAPAKADTAEIEMQKSRLLNALQSMGVPPSRVHSATESSDRASYLEARIFVE